MPCPTHSLDLIILILFGEKYKFFIFYRNAVNAIPSRGYSLESVQSLSQLRRNLVTMEFELNIYYVMYADEKKS
jgi:hypothetical protein